MNSVNVRLTGVPNEFRFAGVSGFVTVGVTPGGHARILVGYEEKTEAVSYMNRDQFDSLIDSMIGLRNLLPMKPL